MHISSCRVYYLIPVFLLIIKCINGQTTSFSRNSNRVESLSIETTTTFMSNDTYNSIGNNNYERTNNTLINSKSNVANNGNPAFSNILTNETTIESTFLTVTHIETYTTSPLKTCDFNRSNDIVVKNRTSSMFTALITYNNCSSINSSELFVFVSESVVENCFVTEDIPHNMDDTIINVTCENIMNKAGRDWTFNIGSKFFHNQIIFNEIFIVTLEPLSLNTSTYIDVMIDKNLTSALIFIPNCADISDIEYLIFRCSDSNGTLSENCTYTCSNIQFGSIYNLSLVRLPIPIADEDKNFFPEENLYKEFQTNLDKVTNFTFKDDYQDRKTAQIYFNHPRGNFDEIYLNCSTQDQHCSNNISILTNTTGNCSECDSITISPIIRGVSYQCQAITIKENFINVTSDQFSFRTDLEPVLYEKEGEKWFSNTTKFVFNVTQQSDFDRLESICITENNIYPCQNLAKEHNQCITTLENDGNLGCNYQCYFITKKSNYSNKFSKNFTMDIFPPTPNLSLNSKTSRSITVKWAISQPAYVECFELLLNQTQSVNLSKTTFSYTWKELLPNRQYKFRLLLNSKHIRSSQRLFVKTLEDAPEKPTDDDTINKILPIDNDTQSQSEQYVIEIDPSLFSNDNGIIYYYRIYIRQDLRKNTSEPDLIGTYYAALKNNSIDYLAFNITISPPNNSFLTDDNKLRLIIGNDTCRNDSNENIPCNGKLKADTTYKIIVNACTKVGCSSALSKSFQTKIQIQPQNSSKAIIWFIIIPILVVLIVAIFITWQRKHIKSLYLEIINSDRQSSISSDSSNESVPLNSISKTMRPKLLIEYLHINQEVENEIYDEFKELERISPQYHKSDYDPKLAVYDRYKNIPARGTWEQTAVCLTGQHRSHDYINANKITSFDKKRTYIACQGPLEDTCQDFWDMIIQYKSKCYSYFPNGKGEQLKFLNIIVKVNHIENYSHTNLEIRHLSIRHYDVKHDVIHYYYTGWSDFSVIEATKLLALIERVNKHGSSPSSVCNRTTNSLLPTPIVVHCSAGVGRTGTYLTVDTIVRLLDRPDNELMTYELDVMGIVYQLRHQRVKMVQTKEQYLLIYRCVEQHLKQTNRLDVVLQESPIYVNFGDLPSKLTSNNYMNISIVNDVKINRSNIDPPRCDVNSENERLSSERSNTILHVYNHQDRSYTKTRRPTRDSLQNNYYPKIEHDNKNDHPQPRLPPRRKYTEQTRTSLSQFKESRHVIFACVDSPHIYGAYLLCGHCGF
ncbi:unnamed protein product [Rotaria sordida]|uniref:protein-tyrosine-phosphatase n=1 Tax=Rotaria sordida TaxID=392033 RepID=A0A814FQI0_9BILA|nr:unnamed protein product [Rotaria sordida]